MFLPAWSRMVPRTRAEEMPRRVRRAIIAQQLESERLIGWIQLAVVLIFATLYAISPKTAPQDATFNPVPWVLLGYFLFTCARIVLAYRAWLPRWFLVLSAVADMALLMLLIWSFHLQYMQPAAFYLKAPTWAYVFIFIALRALRFEPRYVITAGIAAMCGWAVLVGYALVADHGMPVTRDFIAYMSGPVILLGAEFDKMITIALVTVILALALDRGRRILVRSATDRAAARDLARFFPPGIARQITAAEQPLRAGQGELREAAVLQVDLKSFTKLAASLTPDQAIGLLTEYHARLVPVIHRHGGSVDKFLGDGIMATFGADSANEQHAADALRAAIEIAETMRGWTPTLPAGTDPAARDRTVTLADALERVSASEPLVPPSAVAISMGVACGTVVVGAVGNGDRLEYTVIGNSVNRAAKLEKHTRIEQVSAVTDAGTLEQARSQGFEGGPFDALGLRRVAGLAEPVELVVLA